MIAYPSFYLKRGGHLLKVGFWKEDHSIYPFLGGDGHLSLLYGFIWEGIATYCLTDGGKPFIYIIGKGWSFIYPCMWEGLAIHLPFYLGRSAQQSTHLFEKGMPFTCPCMWEAIFTYVHMPIYWKGLAADAADL